MNVTRDCMFLPAHQHLLSCPVTLWGPQCKRQLQSDLALRHCAGIQLFIETISLSTCTYPLKEAVPYFLQCRR